MPSMSLSSQLFNTGKRMARKHTHVSEKINLIELNNFNEIIEYVGNEIDWGEQRILKNKN